MSVTIKFKVTLNINKSKQTNLCFNQETENLGQPLYGKNLSTIQITGRYPNFPIGKFPGTFLKASVYK